MTMSLNSPPYKMPIHIEQSIFQLPHILIPCLANIDDDDTNLNFH